jgi:carboxyl-terminal processing protease
LTRFILALFFAACTLAQIAPREQTANLSSFELIWTTIRDRHPDPQLNGLDWQAIHDAFKPRVEHAGSADEVRTIFREMIGKLGLSHYAIIPGDLYASIGEAPASGTGDATTGIATAIIDGKAVIRSVAADSPAARAGVRPGMVLDSIDDAKVAPLLDSANTLADSEARLLAAKSVARKLTGPADSSLKIDLLDADGHAKHVELARLAPQGTMVQFANLPETLVEFESRILPGGAGYIRFNKFLDPVTLMPRFEAALHDFAHAPGIVLDLRGNPGGIGVMAMGIAGFFVDESGRQLGVMKMRDTTLKFTVFPRADIYAGQVAILLDEGSASTTEILAQGLRDLGRARIFGTRSAGAALPSDIIRLPNGDGFQFPTASYTSAGGRVLEGNGVIPDVEVRQTRESIASGRDPVIDAAVQWILAR